MKYPNIIYFPGVRERSQEQCVRETCEASLLLSLHPRSSLTLILQVVHDDGSVSFGKTLCCVVPLKFISSPLSCSRCGVSRWVFFLTCSSALVLLVECCLHGSYGCRPAYELPVLWSDLCHRHRRSDHHRPHCSSGKGTSEPRVFVSKKQQLQSTFILSNFFVWLSKIPWIFACAFSTVIIFTEIC